MLEIFNDIEIEESEEDVFSEYEYDFNAQKLTGKIIKGLEAVKTWAFFALQIQRYRFRLFSWDYGGEWENLIGKNYGFDFTETEIKRYINDCLTACPYITGTDSFEVAFSESELDVRFRLLTVYGESEMRQEYSF